MVGAPGTGARARRPRAQRDPLEPAARRPASHRHPLPRRIVLTCPPGAGIPVGWFRGGPSPAAGPDGLFRLATCCSKDCDAHEPTATLVVFHSRDGGWTWSGISTVPRWGPLFTAGWYPRDAEIALGVVDNSSLLIVNRVTTDIEGSQHKYVN